MGNYYNPVNIKIDTIDVIEEVLHTIKPQISNIVLLHRGGDFSETAAGRNLYKYLENYEVKQI